MQNCFKSIFLFILIFTLAIPAQENKLLPGNYKVGFKTFKKADTSRKGVPGYSDKSGLREIKIYCWYPAADSELQSPNNYTDYLELMAEDFQIFTADKKGDVQKLINSKMLFMLNEGDVLNKLLESKIFSIFNAAPNPGQFPLIIIGQGYSYESPVSQAAICEFLASHGYVVATAPLVGGAKYRADVSMDCLQAYFQDLNFLKDMMKNDANVNPAKIAVQGFDLGGMTALLLQMNDRSVKAMVTTDAGIMVENNLALLRKSDYYKPDEFEIPFLHFTRTAESNKKMGVTENLELLEANSNIDKTLVRIENMRHIDFTSFCYWGLTKEISIYGGPAKGDPVLSNIKMSEIILAFYNRQLKNDDVKWMQLQKYFDGKTFDKEKIKQD